VDVTFSDRRCQELCASPALLRRALGERGAKAAIAHLASLRAASSLAELRHLPGRCRERRGVLVLSLPDGAHLVFESAEPGLTTNDDGALDWVAVRAVRVLEIVIP
jgi:hypothetical protein